MRDVSQIIVRKALGEDFPRPINEPGLRQILFYQLFHLADYDELELFHCAALEVVLLDNKTDLVPEPVLGIPNVILLNLRLVVRPYLLDLQEFMFDEING